MWMPRPSLIEGWCEMAMSPLIFWRRLSAIPSSGLVVATPSEPAWDALGHSVCCAWSELMRLEAAHAPREKVNAQRRHAKALTRRWSLAMGAAS